MGSEEVFALFPPMNGSNDDAEVAEKSPNGRYIRYNEVLSREFGAAATKVSYKGFDVVDGMEITWIKLYGNDSLNAVEVQVVEEIRLNSFLRHKNIIKSYRTWVDLESESINVITESFTSGNLREFRKKHRGVDVVVIKNWARQILQGLCYLHTHDPPIVHGDLTCENIFVNGNTGEVKIGGLGLIKDQENDPSVDTYAFGICMLELVNNTTSEYCLKIEEGNKGKQAILLEKVKDIQARQFIEKCLVPSSTTTMAVQYSVEELLKDPFLEKTSTSLPTGNCHPVAVTEFKALNGRNEFRLTGERRDENSASLVLRMVDLLHPRPRVMNIEFAFCVDKDTTLSVAGEMVQELDLQMEDASLIVELMDNMIITMGWLPSFRRFTGVKSLYPDPIFGF